MSGDLTITVGYLSCPAEYDPIDDGGPRGANNVLFSMSCPASILAFISAKKGFSLSGGDGVGT